MSSILTSRIRNHIEIFLKGLLYLNDCPHDEQKMLSRGLTAICLAGLTNTSYPQIVKYVTDGSKDNGIDGVLYNLVQNKLYLVQSKWSPKGSCTIDTDDLKKFIAGAYDLLNEEWKSFNHRFKAISSEISMGIRKDPEIVLVVAYNGDDELSPDCRKIVDRFLNENNSDSHEVVSFRVFDLKDLVKAIHTIKSGEREEQNDLCCSIFGKMSCTDVARLYKSHEESHSAKKTRSTFCLKVK